MDDFHFRALTFQIIWLVHLQVIESHYSLIQCDQVWRNFAILGEKFKVFGKFLKV